MPRNQFISIFLIGTFLLFPLNKTDAFLARSMRKAKKVSDPCVAESVPATGTVCHGGALFVGVYQSGRYMITPGGCTNSTNPTCAGGYDSTTKYWNNNGGDTYDVPGAETLGEIAVKSSQLYRGNVNTDAILAYKPTSQAAKYCADMSFGGYNDWFLPSKSELSFVYCKAVPFTGHNALYPEDAPNCTEYGGKVNILTGFVNASYWTSTEKFDDPADSADYKWRLYFSDGHLAEAITNDFARVRCVRRYYNENPCPENYILIPADSYSSSPFCVAKYEMKNVGGVATSQPTGTPWVNIARGTDSASAGAWKTCMDIGTNYNLISNAQWQSIATNIASVSTNWSGGSVGTGSLNRGHVDGTPNSALAADADDNNGCSGTGDTCDGSTWHQERRTHKLADGQVIWDFSGNVWEWVRMNYADLLVSPAITTSWQEISGLSARNKALFGPINGAWDSTQGIGKALGGSAGGIIRSSSYLNSSLLPGIFTINLNNAVTASGGNIGFRCVYVP